MELTIEQQNDTKNKILTIIDDYIHREGIKDLKQWLLDTDYFTAPASTRYHLSCTGGLAQHSLNVASRLLREINSEYGSIEKSPYSVETLTIVGLFHDLCKVNFYTIEMRNAKNENGQWVKVPYFGVKDQLPIEHSSKSQYVLSQFLKLEEYESLAIFSHMGGFDSSVKGGSCTIGNAFAQCPLAVLLHTADVKATSIDEVDK